MNSNIYNVLGVMSGTSLDGVDLCYVRFKKDKEWHFEIMRTETAVYSGEWKNTLQNAIDLMNKDLATLDAVYTAFLGDIILDFITENKISNLDLVSSHGHTVFHQPEKSTTKQIGNLPLIAKKLNKIVVCDFRVQDVQLGGQGAPLVPIGDELLFSDYYYCLNLGGFANISFKQGNNRIAYDICPVNIVLNHYAGKLGFEYDENGKLAKNGDLDVELFKALNRLPYYNESPPKSLGLEWVIANIFPLIDSYEINYETILRTFCEHVAYQISMQLDNINVHHVLITGGGAFNNFLIERLKSLTQNKIIIPSSKIINYKEALIFALLGVLRIRNEVNCLSCVTGAEFDHSSGNIFTPQKQY